MFIITISIILAHVYALTCPDNQTLFDNKCIDNSCFDKYNKRFQGEVDQNGVARLNMHFTGQVEFLGGNLQASIKFSDISNDQTMNRDNPLSCIKDQLVNYKQEDFTEKSPISNTIVSNFDSSTFYTTWKYNLTMTQLEQYAIKDTTKTGIIDYYGYQGLEFRIEGQIQVTYNFNYKVSLNTTVNAAISTSFTGLVQKETASCNPTGSCIAKADSEVAFYTDISCTTKKTVPNLYLNQRIFLKQWITTNGFENFDLTLLSVYYRGEGLKRQTTPFQIVSKPGSLCMELSVEFVYSNVKIVLDSVLGDGSNAASSSNTESGSTTNTNTGTTTNTNTGNTGTTTNTNTGTTTNSNTGTTTNTNTGTTTNTNTGTTTNPDTGTTTTNPNTGTTTTNPDTGSTTNTETGTTPTNTDTGTTTNTTDTSSDAVITVYSTSSIEQAHAMAEVEIGCIKLDETSTSCPTCEEIATSGLDDPSCKSIINGATGTLFIGCMVSLLLFS